jgi:hypothetical protein
MKMLFAGLVCAALMAGCTTAPVPKDYTGPLATIRDTAVSESGSRAQFYFLSEIDGRRIDNILGETRRANSGRGFSLEPVLHRRDVPAHTVKLKIEGRVAYGAPIQEMVNASTVYSVERTIDARLDSNKNYVVKGVLTAEKREVWLEEQGTGRRVE